MLCYAVLTRNLKQCIFLQFCYTLMVNVMLVCCGFFAYKICATAE